MIPCGLSSSLPFQRRAKACFRDARSIFMSPPEAAARPRCRAAQKREPCLNAGSNAQAWAGRGTGTQIIRTGTVFQCAPAAADPAAAARGELTEVGAEREGSALGGNFSSGDVCRAAVIPPWAKTCWLGMCGRRRCISLYSKPASQSQTASFYQEALRTPGIWPLYASSRKQIRQMP